ncbi:MAG TPA: biotin/lipoyl-binding protein [Thermoanaerobaculia bacterium]|nr:biotin/lipoyl-binding protein [Thermoanaerobaculia bacterium]
MKRFLLPVIGVLAALWAAYSVARTAPHRRSTNPPAPAPVSDFPRTVAAVGLIEASSENIAVGTPLAGVVSRIFVKAGQSVKAGEALFALDTRQLNADLAVRRSSLAVARSGIRVARARLDELQRNLDFAEGLSDKRAISAEETVRRRTAVTTGRAQLDEAQTQASAAEAQIRSVETEIERSTIRAPLDAQVLQVKIHAGEYAPAAVTATPLVLLGGSLPFNVRVDVDEHEAWRVQPGAPATAHVRGDARLKTPLQFVRFEPFVVPKKSLTGDSTERVDTRVLQVIYRIDRQDLPLFVGQQMDVFIDASRRAGG